MNRLERLQAEMKDVKAAHDELAGRLNSGDPGQKARLWDAVSGPLSNAMQNLVGRGEPLPGDLADRVLQAALKAIYGADVYDLIKKLRD